MATNVNELHDFVIALARQGVAEGVVSLEVFTSWMPYVARSEVKEDRHGPYIERAGGAIKIRPVTTTATRTFETADEVASFIESSKSLKNG